MPNESIKRWNGFGIVLLIAVLVPVLHVLSVGAFRMTHGQTADVGDLWQVFYAPVDWICVRSDMVSELLAVYVDVWTPANSLAADYEFGVLEVAYKD